MTMIEVSQILPNPEQPRKEFDPVELESLANSISENGLIQPISVEGPFQDGSYILIDGERRLRAHKLAGMAWISAEVHSPNGHDPQTRLKLALTANMQRADLDLIEEGRAFRRLSDMGLTYKSIARMIGRSTGSVSIKLKLLELDPEIQELYSKRLLPVDPAVIYGLAKLPDEKRVTLARKFAANGTPSRNIIGTINKILNRRNDERDIPLTRKNGRSPAMQLSDGSENNEIGKVFQMLSKAGVNLPEWELVRQAADETCENCELSDMASTQMCRDCPAVEMLKRMARLAEREHGK